MLVRQKDIFRSRWNALIWAGGVLLTAYCSMPSLDEATSDGKEAHGRHESKQSTNPWALEAQNHDERD